MKQHEARPSFAHLLLTMGCNLRCPQCFVDAGRKLKGEMDTFELLKVADELVNMKVHTVHVEGGEALLAPDAILILKRLNKLRDVLLVTNGTLVNRDVARSLAETGMKKVALSLDGATPETHNYFRPKTYGKIVNAIHLLRQAGLSVRISTTLMKPNFKEALLLLEQCLAWGVDILNYDAFDMIGRGMVHPELQLSSSDWKFISYELLPRAIEVSEQMQVKVAIPSKYLPMLDVDSNDPHFDWLDCTSAVSQISILPDGSVIPCFVLATMPEYIAGNVKKQPLQEIWEQSPYMRYYRTLTGCKRCPMGYEGHMFFSNVRN
jgi:MoaA/NifB/PqqE/SkfB family radical SAM enzyme